MSSLCSGRLTGLAGLLAATILLSCVAGCTNRSSKPGAPDLTKKLKDADATVRIKAADDLRILGREKAKDAIPDLAAMLGDDNEKCRIRAAEALGTYGEDSYAILMENAKSDKAHVRAMSWLGIGGLEVAVYTKHQAEYAKALKIALKDEHLEVRHHAASSFYRHNITAPDAYPIVVAALGELGEKGEDKKILCYLLDGLRNLSDEEKKTILDIMPTLRKLSQHNDTDVKGLATSLLLSLEKVQK